MREDKTTAGIIASERLFAQSPVVASRFSSQDARSTSKSGIALFFGVGVGIGFGQNVDSIVARTYTRWLVVELRLDHFVTRLPGTNSAHQWEKSIGGTLEIDAKSVRHSDDGASLLGTSIDVTSPRGVDTLGELTVGPGDDESEGIATSSVQIKPTPRRTFKTASSQIVDTVVPVVASGVGNNVRSDARAVSLVIGVRYTDEQVWDTSL